VPNKIFALHCLSAIPSAFTDVEISAKIAELLKPEETECDVEIIFQSVDVLHKAIPDHTGDYPTPGGRRIVNKAFLNYYEGKNERAY